MSHLLDSMLVTVFRQGVQRRIAEMDDHGTPKPPAVIPPHHEARESDLTAGADSMLDYAVREQTKQNKEATR